MPGPDTPHTIDGLINFRDIGGYRTPGGRRVATGRIFRSAHLAELDEAGYAQLGELGLRAIIDLRNPAERRRGISRLPVGFSGTVLAVTDAVDGDALHVDAVLALAAEGGDAGDIMIRSYRRAPFAPDRITLFGAYFDMLATGGFPLLIHCTAGKDRTGMLVALTQHLLGLGWDDIVSEYLLTMRDIGRLSHSIETWLARQYPDLRLERTVLDALVGVDAAYLTAGFESIRQAHGSVEQYLEDVLGLDGGKRERIRDNLLVTDP